MAGLDLCSICKKGYLRPTGEVATDAEATEPFRETGSMRKLVCDNPECESKTANADINEYIPVSDSLSMKVTKAADVERMKNNPRLCTSCQTEKEIVVYKGSAKFCQGCWDNLNQKPEEL